MIVVRCIAGVTDGFKEEMRLHQGLALSPFLDEHNRGSAKVRHFGDRVTDTRDSEYIGRRILEMELPG